MDVQKKRICLILPGKLPVPNIRGGAIETLLTLLADQNERYNKVRFIIIAPWAAGIDEVSEKYKNTEFHYFKIRSGIWKKGINFINYIIARRFGNIDFFKTPMHRDIEKMMRTIKADYVVVEHGVYKHFDFLSKSFQRSRLYLHLHGAGPMPDKKTVQTFGNVIAVSEFIKDFYKNGFLAADTKFHVCQNGIDDFIFGKKTTPEKRQKIRSSFGVQEDDFLVIYCGRLVHEKGVKELIRAVVDTENPHIKLMIVGSSNFEGAQKTKYMQELETMRAGNEKRIFFTGFFPNNELYRYYQSADIQAVCSICEEAAGLVVVEGMMSGIPQIITDSGGIQEYADPACSICIEKRDSLTNPRDSLQLSAQLTQKLNELYTKYLQDDCLPTASAVHSEKFDAKHFYERFISLF